MKTKEQIQKEIDVLQKELVSTNNARLRELIYQKLRLLEWVIEDY